MSASGVALRKAANRKNDATPKARRVPLGERVTAAHIWPVVLAVFAFFAAVLVFQNRGKTVTVPVAARTIAAGASIDASMLSTASLPAQSSLAATVVPSASLKDGGWVAAVTIHQGDPITQSVVQRAAASQTGSGTMSLTLPADHANGGNLVPGDRIDVISAASGQAQYVARGLSVISVASPSHGSGLSAAGPSSFYVVVAVDPPTALSITAALQSGTTGGQGFVEVVRTTGEANDNNDNAVPPALSPSAAAAATSATTLKPGR